jgi:copper homeostasis protein
MERHRGSKAIGRPLITIEAAVESVESAVAGESDGAGRIELCANLGVGGTTPTADLIAAVLEKTQLPVFVMIRPRGGSFVYSDAEFAEMTRDIERARTMGIGGIVTGVLEPDGGVDVDRTRSLVEAAAGLPVTFHRAFDRTRNLPDALEQLIEIGVARVLTSGGAPTALDGASAIAALVAQSRGRISILAGGGVREHNVRELVARTGVGEVHSRDVRRIRRALTG